MIAVVEARLASSVGFSDGAMNISVVEECPRFTIFFVRLWN